MNAMMSNLLRALVGGESGRSCRRCSQSIHVGDAFGVSEGVCRPCRGLPVVPGLK